MANDEKKWVCGCNQKKPLMTLMKDLETSRIGYMRQKRPVYISVHTYTRLNAQRKRAGVAPPSAGLALILMEGFWSYKNRRGDDRFHQCTWCLVGYVVSLARTLFYWLFYFGSVTKTTSSLINKIAVRYQKKKLNQQMLRLIRKIPEPKAGQLRKL